jgi:hypothetical protein
MQNVGTLAPQTANQPRKISKAKGAVASDRESDCFNAARLKLGEQSASLGKQNLHAKLLRVPTVDQVQQSQPAVAELHVCRGVQNIHLCSGSFLFFLLSPKKEKKYAADNRKSVVRRIDCGKNYAFAFSAFARRRFSRK